MRRWGGLECLYDDFLEVGGCGVVVCCGLMDVDYECDGLIDVSVCYGDVLKLSFVVCGE